MKSIHSNEYKHLLQLLVEARKEADLTQAEVAARFGKPQSFMAKVENGERRLDVIEFMKLCELIDASPFDLMKAVRKPPTRQGNR